MRLFIGLPFGDRDRRSFKAIQAVLKRQAARGNFTAFGNFHLTLAFLGEQPESRLAHAFAALNSVDFPAMDLTFTSLGRFDGGVWYLSPAYDELLFDCQARLAQALRREGFSLEARPYVPHLTLGRKILLAEGTAPEEELRPPLYAHSPGPRLFLSHRSDGALRYDPLTP